MSALAQQSKVAEPIVEPAIVAKAREPAPVEVDTASAEETPSAYSNPDYPWASNYDPGPKNPGWAVDPEVVDRHQQTVREILGDNYQLAPDDPRVDQLVSWTDPLATAPDMPKLQELPVGVGEDGPKGTVGLGENAVGGELKLGDDDLGAKIEANLAFDQNLEKLESEGGHFTSLGNAISMLGGPVGAATSTDAYQWGISVDGTVKGVGVHGGVNGSGSDTSAYYAAIQNFPIEGLSPDLTDPVSQAARQAYIEQHPEEFAAWLQQRREAVLGDAESMSEFDWQKLQTGEAVSFSEASSLGGEVGAEYRGIGISLGGSDEQIHEVTMAMAEEGMLDIAVTAMDKATAELGLSAGDLTLDASRTGGDVSQIKFRIDTTTEEGKTQASLFTKYGLFPGATDSLPEDQRKLLEEALAGAATGEATGADLAALVAEANGAFLEAHREGDLPTAGATTYQNMELGEIEGGSAELGLGGLHLLDSKYEEVMSENRYRNEQGLTESEYAYTHSLDQETFEIPLLGIELGEEKHVDTFALTNPEFDEDVALYAGLVGDYGSDLDVPEGKDAAYTVLLRDDQMAGLDEYLDSIGASEEALFNSDAADYFFSGTELRLNGTTEEHSSYVGHDGKTYTCNGEDDGSGQGQIVTADERARMMGIDLDGNVMDRLSEDQRAQLEAARETYGKDISLENLMALEFGKDLYAGMRADLLNEIDAKLGAVQSVEDFRALDDPKLQSMYIQSAAIRLTYEEKNPMLALSLAFELEDEKVRNEVLRDVLAHLPGGIQELGELIGDAQASDPELAKLLAGAVEEGTVDARE